jgi:hypothetical protein
MSFKEMSASRKKACNCAEKEERTTSQAPTTEPALLAVGFAAALGALALDDLQDLGGWQDDHAEKDVEESQRGSGQDAPACRCPLEQELLGRHPQWHGKGNEPVRFEATHRNDSLVQPDHTRTAQL